MRLTKKLLGFLHRVFNKDPAQFLALRLNHAGAGMTWNVADGVLTTAPKDAFLFAEVQRNLFRYSQQFDQAAWVNQAVTVIANSTVAPDGTTTADTVSNTASVVSSLAQNIVLLNGAPYTVSIYVSPLATNKTFIMERGRNDGTQEVAIFDMNILSAAAASGTASITTLASGWYRLAWTFNTAVTGPNTFNGFYLGAYGASSTSASFAVWGAQLEQPAPAGAAGTTFSLWATPQPQQAFAASAYTATGATYATPAVPTRALSIDLRSYTITTLVNFLAAQPGYSVSYADATPNAQLAASVLLDGSGDVSLSNGNALYGYTGFLFAYLEAQAQELAAAEAQIAQALRQMTTKTAEGEWLDLLGSYYGVPRLVNEADVQYGPRIIPEVLRPRGNNIAIQAAITSFTGQPNTVTDAVNYGAAAPAYGGAISFNGAQTFSTAATPVYGLFDVAYSYDLLGGASVAAFSAQVKDLVNRMRDAGTQMRALLLQSSAITDTAPASQADGAAVQSLNVGYAVSDTVQAPTETFSNLTALLGAMADAAVAPNSDSLTLQFSSGTTYNALRSYNGAITYASGASSQTL